VVNTFPPRIVVSLPSGGAPVAIGVPLLQQLVDRWRGLNFTPPPRVPHFFPIFFHEGAMLVISLRK